jgi:hypothetical protein
MIRGFEPIRPAEPQEKGHLQWMPALGAGLIAGIVLLIVPRGSPWNALTFFTPTILGRVVPDRWDVPMLAVSVIHLGISLIYGLLISLTVIRVREMRAVLAGGIAGLVLYLINLGVVSLWIPELRGSEVSVIVTHAVFGLITAGAYRGLLRRKTVPTIPAP